MNSNNWRDEYGENSEVRRGDASTLDENLTGVVLDGITYFINLPENRVASLGLLDSGIDSPEKAHQLSQFLQFLKNTRNVRTVDGNGETVDQTTARRMFVAALQRKEAQLASLLTERIERTEAADYICG